MANAKSMQTALDQLAKQLGDVTFRKKFKEPGGAEKAAKAAKIKVADLPTGLLDTLSQMEEDELAIVSTVHEKLRTSSPDPSKMAILF
jgi:hypothetical protein